MSRSVFFLALFLGSASCATNGEVVLYDDRPNIPQPGYVYLYEDGSCWIDDMLYLRCPWGFGSRQSGYYWSYGGRWYWQEHYRWQSRLRPPPRAWRHPPSMRPHHYPHGYWQAPRPRYRPHHRQHHRPRHIAPPARAR